MLSEELVMPGVTVIIQCNALLLFIRYLARLIVTGINVALFYLFMCMSSFVSV